MNGMNSGREPVEHSRGDADFHQAEAIRLASSGNLAEALKHFQAATRLRPDNPVWHFNCGLALQQLTQLANAIAAYRQAIALKPDFFDAWSNLSAACKGAGDFDAAVEAGQRAVALQPRSAGAHLNLGNALKAQGAWAAAESTYRTARNLDPANPRIQLNLANTLREIGRIPEAVALLREAVVKSPRFAEAHRDLAFALLLSGDFIEGWMENEWRWETEEMARGRRSFDRPAWSRQDLAGRRLFVYTEQGFGDAIQFVRYIELVIQRGGEVVLECQPDLQRLFQTVKGVSQLVARGDPSPPFDFQAPLMSLPRIMGTTLETVPNRVPYLAALDEWAEQLPSPNGARLKVGLVWAGNPSHLNDRARSLPLEMLKPLFDLEATAFYSLQVGERAHEIKRAGLFGKMAEASSQRSDFASTAAVITQLDLVISVDTSVAHLAGALAKPIWLLLPFAPDWRWLLGRNDSPWYPTMHTFRQASPGDWPGVIREVRARLRSLVASSSGQVIPG